MKDKRLIQLNYCPGCSARITDMEPQCKECGLVFYTQLLDINNNPLSSDGRVTRNGFFWGTVLNFIIWGLFYAGIIVILSSNANSDNSFEGFISFLLFFVLTFNLVKKRVSDIYGTKNNTISVLSTIFLFIVFPYLLLKSGYKPDVVFTPPSFNNNNNMIQIGQNNNYSNIAHIPETENNNELQNLNETYNGENNSTYSVPCRNCSGKGYVLRPNYKNYGSMAIYMGKSTYIEELCLECGGTGQSESNNPSSYTKQNNSYETPGLLEKNGQNNSSYKIEKSNITFSDVSGAENLKKKLFNEVIDPLKNSEKYYKYNIKPPNGILFYGPPGCGKTFVGKALAGELGFNFIYANSTDIGSIYQFEPSLNLRELFETLRKNTPIVLFLDEFDSLAPNRSRIGGENTNMNQVVNELLTSLEKLPNDAIVIAATNHKQNLDPAVIRSGRFDLHILIEPPDLKARIDLLAHYLSKTFATNNINIQQIAAQSEGYSAADIKELVNTAAKEAAQKNEKISTNHLKNVIRSKNLSHS